MWKLFNLKIQFIVCEYICELYFVLGPGKSKKIAKRNAAHALLKKLREGIALSDDDVTLEEEADEDDADDHIPLVGSRASFGGLSVANVTS